MYPFESSPLVTGQTSYTGRQSMFMRAVFLVIFLVIGGFVASFPSYIAIGAVRGKELLMLMFTRNDGSMAADEYATAVNTLISEASGTRLVMFTQLIGTVASAGAVLLFALCIEKRSLVSLGLACSAKKSVICYVGGGIIGAAMIAITVGICALTGANTVSAGGGSIAWILLFLCGFLVHGFYEELLVHGYIMTMFLASGRRVWLAVGVSSFLFALLHIGNTGITFTAVMNLLLFGALAGLLTLRTGSLYAAFGMNALWNFSEVCVFGQTTGTSSAQVSFFRIAATAGREMTNGGAYGISGGLVLTLVLLAAIIAVVFLPSKSAKTASTA